MGEGLGDVEDLYLYRRLPQIVAQSAPAEEQLLDLFPADEVRSAIENLPEAFLLPLLLSEIDGFTYKEIAEILEVPIGTVMSRLHRGRKALQEALYRYAMDRHLITDEGSSNG